MKGRQIEAILSLQAKVAILEGDLRETYDIIVQSGDVMPHSSGAAIEILEGDRLYYAAQRGKEPSEVEGVSLALKGSLSGLAVVTGRPFICMDSETDHRVDIEACRRINVRSMLVAPIPYRGEYIGVLKFYSDKPRTFSEADEHVAQLLVGMIAVSLSRISEVVALEMQGKLQAAIRHKQEFVSMVSHELKTPLTAILGALTLADASNGQSNSPSVDPLVKLALRNAKRLKRLVNDLMDVHALDEGGLSFDLAHVELGHVIAEVHRDMLPILQAAEVGCEIRQREEAIWLVTDPHRLSQALTNVLSNAIRHSPGGSSVRVILDHSESWARIRIEDDGPGIPDEFRAQLFERFTMANGGDRPRDKLGSGLGLYITRQILTELSGTIELDSSYDSGAAFEIMLPLSSNVAD